MVLAAEDLSNGIVSRLQASGFDLPLFVVAGPEDDVDLDVHGVTGVLASDDERAPDDQSDLGVDVFDSASRGRDGLSGEDAVALLGDRAGEL